MYNNKLDVIKRGSKIIFLQYREIAFVDAMMFGPGCSLDSFAKMWGTEATKGFFPYDKYETIDEMLGDVNWPKLSDFNSKLGRQTFEYSLQDAEEKLQSYNLTTFASKEELLIKIMTSDDKIYSPIDLDTYCQMWSVFENGKRDGRIQNMMDFLCFYNARDTEVLADAMVRYSNAFMANFNICPIEYITLPAIAEKVLWNFYDDTLFKPFSFNQEFGDVAALIRSQLAGGLSCVFTRHVEVGAGEMKYDYNVYHAANGHRFTQLIAFDVNSEFHLNFHILLFDLILIRHFIIYQILMNFIFQRLI